MPAKMTHPPAGAPGQGRSTEPFPLGFPSDARALTAASFRVHVGVDCGKTFHKMVARGPDGHRRAPKRVDVTRTGFLDADLYLRKTFPRVARKHTLIGMEFAGSYGTTFARFLLKKGYGVVSVLPSVTKHTREVEDNSPQKDDDKDAAQVCRLVGAGLYRPYAPRREPEATLRLLIAERQHLVEDATRLRSRLQARLSLTWPEFETLFATLDRRTPRALLAALPLPADVASVDAKTLRRMTSALSNNKINAERTAAIRQSARQTVGCADAPDAERAGIRRLLARWGAVDEQVVEVTAALATVVEGDRCFAALLTIPEMSIVSAAAIVGEIGDVHRFQSPRQIIKLAGLNLARRQSGTSVLGPLRITKHGRVRLRHQLFLLAGRWCKPGGLYRPRYEQMLARNGNRKLKALVAVARALVPLVYRVLVTGDPFDEQRWRAAHRGV